MEDQRETTVAGRVPDVRKASAVPARIVVIDDYSAARGGATTLALLSARLFREQGIPVTYLCGDSGTSQELADLGVSVVALNSRDLLRENRATAFVRGIHNPSAARMVSKWIADNDTSATIYHVHGWSQILSPAIFTSLSKVTERCVVHAHDFFAVCPNGAHYDYQAGSICARRPLGIACIATDCDKRSYPQKLWRVARGANVARLLKQQPQFSSIILLHDRMKDYFRNAGYASGRLRTVPNPVAFLSSERVKAEHNDEYFFIGRLSEEKGIEDALAATQRADVKLCVIGDGQLMAKVQASGPRVRALGWLPHTQIREAIKAARAVLMPSRYPEPFGLVAIEAARSGVPVILSKDAFIADDMVAAGMAQACDTRDQEAFGEVLRQFQQMKQDEVRRMSERAFQSWSGFALTNEEWRDALLGEYRRLIVQSSAPETMENMSVVGGLLA